MNTIQKYLAPKTIHDACVLHAQYPGAKYISGGTDVMQNQFQETGKAQIIIDLSRIEEMKGIAEKNGMLEIGALTTLDAFRKISLPAGMNMLAEAAHSVGSPLIRKTATIGGNVLCENRCLFYNQSEWWRNSVGYCLKCDGDICIATGGKNACFSEHVSDTAPALIAMNAKIRVQTANGTEEMSLESIYTGDGVAPVKLPDAAILTHILIPLPGATATSFFKLRERKSLEYTSLTVAMAIHLNGSCVVVLGGVDPKPVVVRCENPEDIAQIVKSARKAARAVDNDMYSRNYRREMIDVYIRRGMEEMGVTQTITQ